MSAYTSTSESGDAQSVNRFLSATDMRVHRRYAPRNARSTMCAEKGDLARQQLGKDTARTPNVRCARVSHMYMHEFMYAIMNVYVRMYALIYVSLSLPLCVSMWARRTAVAVLVASQENLGGAVWPRHDIGRARGVDINRQAARRPKVADLWGPPY
jgi:hypothetical protein